MNRRMTDDELIRFEAEELGLMLTDHDVHIVKEKWRMSPTASIRNLLTGIRNLRAAEETKAAEAFAERAWRGDS